jgi:hypothetical protein
MRVEIRPRTGSVLCHFAPERVDPDQLVAAVQRLTGVARVQTSRERSSPEIRVGHAREARAGGSRLSHALSHAFRRMNYDVMEATGGRLDLGALTGLGFLAFGAAEIVVTRRLPVPPWFNLAWWAFRTFTMFQEPNPDEPGAEAGDTPDLDDSAG